jgi:hypothetical protein
MIAPGASASESHATMAKAKPSPRRTIRCYLCGHRFEVSLRTMSTTCPNCNKAIKVEDVTIKTYLPVNDLQTCGKVTIVTKGRVVAKRIMSGEGIVCDGTIEGAIETDGDVILGPKASWKGDHLFSRSLKIADGAKVLGSVTVPWRRDQNGDRPPNGSAAGADGKR